MSPEDWPRIDGHEPLPWSVDEENDLQINRREGEAPIAWTETCVGYEKDQANARLIAAGCAPHLCDVQGCPGPKLVAKLVAAEAMAGLLGALLKGGVATVPIAVALAAWDAAK